MENLLIKRHVMSIVRWGLFVLGTNMVVLKPLEGLGLREGGAKSYGLTRREVGKVKKICLMNG